MTEVLVNPARRIKRIKENFHDRGLEYFEEDPNKAYCFVALTSAPLILNPVLRERKNILINDVLKVAGITGYDPASAPLSPDKNLDAFPDEVHDTDFSKIAGAKFFTGHNLVPSTGIGIEQANGASHAVYGGTCVDGIAGFSPCQGGDQEGVNRQ